MTPSQETMDGDAPAGAGPIRKLSLRLNAVAFESDGILSFEFTDPSGVDLPAFTAGAHIDVHAAPGLIRQYSLLSDPADRKRYRIAVLNEPAGRGGSKTMHETLRPGQIVTVSEPRNQFPLNAGAKRHLLLAGGIGVTPMMAMTAELETRGADWEMHYCTRAPEKTAFLDRLAPHIAAGRVHLHHDGGDPAKGLDIAALLRDAPDGRHLYYCGPKRFMAAVAGASAHWPEGAVHFEFFSSPDDRAKDTAANTPFQIKLKRSGDVLEVPADKSIVEVLREHGHYVDTSCEDGFCGTCLTPYSGGEPEHRDNVLGDSERDRYVLICCARAMVSPLVLDI
ncbi:MAG: PDR/VanB family oxidoreductase [Rhodospirillaceae bacterium]